MTLVNAKAIAPEAQGQEIIPEAVKNEIKGSNSLEEANNALLEHLRSQAILEDLLLLCKIMRESKGYRKMQRFGETLQTRLEKVSYVRTCQLNVSCCLCQSLADRRVEHTHA